MDDVKTDESRKSLVIADDLLERLKVWKQATEFPADGDWIFASPLKLGRLPYSYTGFWRELDRAGKAAGIGHLGTHTFRHSYRMWIDAVGTPIGVQQKLMRHADIRTTMNLYGDAASSDMREADAKIVQLALQTNVANGGEGSQTTERMAPQVGLEPTTLRLTAGCSAIELLRSVVDA